jgi:hypothetical protein
MPFLGQKQPGANPAAPDSALVMTPVGLTARGRTLSFVIN